MDFQPMQSGCSVNCCRYTSIGGWIGFKSTSIDLGIKKFAEWYQDFINLIQSDFYSVGNGINWIHPGNAEV